MRLKKKKLTGKEKKTLMANAIAECESLADKYIAEWKPTNPEWQTIEGAVYLRVSDPSQVLVDQGSFLQQVNMNIAEIKERSFQDKVNYRVIKVFIEPGVSGTIESRPSFQRMNWEIKNGIHHFIVFKEISRLVIVS